MNLRRLKQNETQLLDVHRPIPKHLGGTYTPDNVVVLSPIEHMRIHGNLRIRNEQLERLKEMIDDRAQTIKLKNKIENQVRAYKRQTDHLSQDTLQWLLHILNEVKSKLRVQDGLVKSFVHTLDDPLAKAALSVRAVGEMTVAYCLVYIDLEKARHVSSVWAYAGLHVPSKDRYKKGQSGGGNKRLRTQLYTLADSQVKHRGPYRVIYDRVKERLSNSNKLVWSRTTRGVLKEMPWKETKPSHRDGAGKRAIMKHFLADWWYVGRTLMGLETHPMYAEAVLGNGHKAISPQERGWKV
mgnify:CR=1 FL=1